MIKFKLTVPVVNTNWWESSKNEIAAVLLEENRVDWEAEREPNTGSRWQPRKPPTGGWPILRKTGTMQDRTKIKPGLKGIFSASTVSYGPYHMTGTSRMVARPWLGVPDRSLPRIAGVIGRSVFRGRSRTFS
jgi:hypothetical protein